MKTLLIARHGKSSWIHDELKDIDRSLDVSGIQAVYYVAQQLKSQGIFPDVLLSSPATRAIHTALIHARVLDFPTSKIDIHQSIYYGGEEGVMDLILKQDNAVSSMMICGHNPTSTNLVNSFKPHSLKNLQTSGVVKLTFNIEKWEELNSAISLKSTYFKRNAITDLG